MKYQEEKFKTYLEEAIPLMHKNNEEVNLFGRDLDLDFEAYVRAEQDGDLVSFTVRTEENELVGYCLFILGYHTQHREMLVAHQEVIYITPEHRTCGIRLLRYTEKGLKLKGVDFVIQAAPRISRFSKVLERLGYDELETLYIRSL